MTLAPQDRQVLLKLARDTIASQVHGRRMPDVDLDAVSEDLRREAACFVTLTKHGQLRGCIGSLEARQPLVLDVRDNAIGAAFRDPRFPQVSAEELEDLHVEISVLSHPEPLSYDGPQDLIAKLRPGIDGVVIERGWNRATFLPQVWEKLPDPHEFLQHLCLKAYLPADVYNRPDLDVYTYQVEKFEEGQGIP
ncbi:MAG: AmmeMemoRadiSam system protein A [Anaerolineae bacterium]|nr:AmmeMemoRadiSam system protein A [Anaerolineae bacterium]